MNRDPSRAEPPFDPLEWQLQQCAAGSDDAAGGALDEDAAAMLAQYRQVAAALRSQPRREPPADFAAAVVARVATQRAGIEPTLLRALLLALAASVVVAGVLHGDAYWQALRPWLGAGALSWMTSGAACLALSGLLRWLPAARGARGQVASPH